jgi:hypothetical protein
MSRILTGLAVGLLASAANAPASAADWLGGQPHGFRPAYPMAMEPMEDSLDFEAGLRYFYGMGGQRTSIGPTFRAISVTPPSSMATTRRRPAWAGNRRIRE